MKIELVVNHQRAREKKTSEYDIIGLANLMYVYKTIKKIPQLPLKQIKMAECVVDRAGPEGPFFSRALMKRPGRLFTTTCGPAR